MAEALTLSVPTFAAAGVPLNVRVAALKCQPGGKRRAVGGGCRVGESVAGIDVGERAGGQRQREGRADDRVLAAGLGRKHRRVVGAVNGDRERCRRCGAGRVTHGVAEDIGQRVGRLPQRLYGGIGLVDGVGEGTRGIEHEAAMRSSERGAERARHRAEADRSDGLGVAGVGIGVVGEDIAVAGEPPEPLAMPPFSVASASVGHSRRRGVGHAWENTTSAK